MCCTLLTPPATLKSVSARGKLWTPGQTLRVAFANNVPRDQQTQVFNWAVEWLGGGRVNLKFSLLPGYDSTAEVRVNVVPGKVSSAAVGTDAAYNSPYSMVLAAPGGYPTRANVLHEFGHALGQWHAHQHSKAAIPYNWTATYSYYQRNYGWGQEATKAALSAPPGEVDETPEYDPKGITHYVTPAEILLDPSRAVGHNQTLSETDRKWAEWAYPHATPDPDPADKDGDWIDNIYLDKLGRNASDHEKDLWRPYMSNRRYVLFAIGNSPEGIAYLYSSELERQGSPEEIKGWSETANKFGWLPGHVRDEFLLSQEFYDLPSGEGGGNG